MSYTVTYVTGSNKRKRLLGQRAIGNVGVSDAVCIREDECSMNATSTRGPEWSHVKIVRQELKPDGSKRGDPEVEC